MGLVICIKIKRMLVFRVERYDFVYLHYIKCTFLKHKVSAPSINSVKKYRGEIAQKNQSKDKLEENKYATELEEVNQKYRQLTQDYEVLTAETKEKDEKIADLENQLEKFKKNNEKLVESHELLKNEIKEREEEKSNHLQTISSLKLKVKELEERNQQEIAIANERKNVETREKDKQPSSSIVSQNETLAASTVERAPEEKDANKENDVATPSTNPFRNNVLNKVKLFNQLSTNSLKTSPVSTFSKTSIPPTPVQTRSTRGSPTPLQQSPSYSTKATRNQIATRSPKNPSR